MHDTIIEAVTVGFFLLAVIFTVIFLGMMLSDDMRKGAQHK